MSAAGCVGRHCRQPTSRWPCSAMISSTTALQRARSASFFGKNTLPAANRPGPGRSAPRSAFTTLARNSCGSAVRMPAPSPVLASQPQAPRWSMLRSTSSASRRIWWLRWPLMCATNPTPHESCSNAGSYSPCFSGRCVSGWEFSMAHIPRSTLLIRPSLRLNPRTPIH